VTAELSSEYLVSLVRELSKLPRETEWVEFKKDDANPDEIGEYISALANSAALIGKAAAYVVWGVEDATHRIVGTSFSPKSTKVGNEEIENWLLRLLTPKIDFRFHEMTLDAVPVVLLQIGRAFRHPVQFQGNEFIRVGTYKKRLKAFPEKERELWRIFDQTPFEDMVAREHLSSEDTLRLLDYPSYFDLLERPLPTDRDGILTALESDDLIRRCPAGGWDITNLGAVLFAKQLEEFRPLKRKAVRVIQYRGADRVVTLREQVGVKGYACGFEGLITYVNGLLPSNEVIQQALRKTVPMFPELAVRELVVNALVHQDLFVTGAGPTIEIFDDRIEITNPGQPLVDTQRFIDTPPRSRNEALASLMRRVRICEERGSGIDKVVFEVEYYQLPAPLFEAPEGFTRAVLFAHRGLPAMGKADRVRACYLHACLRHVTRKPMTNTSVRERFGIPEKSAATASRLLNEALEAGVILVQDPEAGTRIRSYVPFWAGGPSREGVV
jgi:ATP-dependent DNA helicase RecG